MTVLGGEGEGGNDQDDGDDDGPVVVELPEEVQQQLNL